MAEEEKPPAPKAVKLVATIPQRRRLAVVVIQSFLRGMKAYIYQPETMSWEHLAAMVILPLDLSGQRTTVFLASGS